ncbi:MAG: MFS transporter [Marinomonas sp.]
MIFRHYPWPMLASIYITQYIGVAFILSAAVAILRQQGVGLDKLALLNLAVLPLMGKIFYAPLIDKYRLGLQGEYRSWLILSQAGMAISLAIAGFMNFEHQFNEILIVLAVYVLLISIQDVSVDGLSCKLFDVNSRKLASSIQFSGNLLGNIIGGGLILMFYSSLGWQGSLWLLAGLTSISFFQLLFFVEPEKAVETTQQEEMAHKKAHFSRDIKDFIKQQKHWFIIMALYPIASTCGFALLNPLLVDSGWSLDDIGFAMKIFGSLIGLCSALFATPLIARVGRSNALISVIFAQVFALLLVIPLTLGFTEKWMAYTAITAHFISFPALLVVSATIIMDKAAGSPHKATFFTLQFSFASLLGFAYSSISMAIAKHLGYSTVVIVGSILAFCIACFICVLLRKVEVSEFDTSNAIESAV